MERAITTTGEVGPDHVLNIAVPTDLPPGRVNVTVSIHVSQENELIGTFRELLDSGLLGMWTDRDDLPTTNEEFTEWRRKLWERRVS